MTPDLSYRSALAELTWPAFPAPGAGQRCRAASKLALLFQIERNQWHTPQQIETAQFEQVRKLLAFAAGTVPHYRQMLGGHFPVADINPQSWRDIPVLTRRALHALPAAIRSEQIPNGHGKNFPVSTSGSTGSPARMSVSKPIRSPFGLRPSTFIRYSWASGGRHMKSRRSGAERMFISVAAS